LQILGIMSALILQAVLITALVSNLLKRRQATRALIDSKAKLQQAADEWKTTFDTIPDLIMVLDREFRIVRVNQATLAFLGLPVQRILGNTCASMVDGVATRSFSPFRWTVRGGHECQRSRGLCGG
jgi:PAS domain-containing protein